MIFFLGEKEKTERTGNGKLSSFSIWSFYLACLTFRPSWIWFFIEDWTWRFGTIRSDTCKESAKNWARLIVARDEEEWKKIEQKNIVHNITADDAYKTLSVDSANANYITLCIYLQQVLFTPKLTHSDVYYQWQYSLCNLCGHNLTDDQANMFFWHGSLAKSGLKLIGSCLLKYIISTYKPLLLGKRECWLCGLITALVKIIIGNSIKLYHYLISLHYFTEINQKIFNHRAQFFCHATETSLS